MSGDPYASSVEFLQKHPQIKAARKAWGWFSFTAIILGTALFILTLMVIGLGHIAAAWLTLAAVAMVSSGDGRSYNRPSSGSEP